LTKSYISIHKYNQKLIAGVKYYLVFYKAFLHLGENHIVLLTEDRQLYSLHVGLCQAGQTWPRHWSLCCSWRQERARIFP